MAVNGLSPSSMFRLSGLASGLDTDQIVANMLKADKIPLDKIKQKKQVAEWKRDDYRDVTNLLVGFKKEYMDVTAKVNMWSQSSYKKFSATAVDSATGNTSSYVSVRASTGASAGTHTITVESVATSEKVSSSVNVSKDILASNDVDWELAKGKDFNLTLDGVTKNISITNDVDSISKFQALLDKAFGENKITATLSDNKIAINSVYGSGVTKVTVSAGTNDALTALGFDSTSAKTNRISVYDTLETLASKFKNSFSFDAENKINLTINGESFSFSSSTTLYTMMSTVNSNSNANVSMKYNENTDSIEITSNQTGKGQGVVISETGSTFLSAVGINKNSVDGVKAMAQVSSMNYASNNKKMSVNIDGVVKEITFSKNYATYDELTSDIKTYIEGAFGLTEGSVNVTQDSGVLSIQLLSGGSSISFGDPSSGTSIISDLGLKSSYVQGKDAEAIIDGNRIVRSSNNFTVDGVEYTLMKENPGIQQNVNLTLDVDGIYTNIKNFVDKYNEVLDTINKKLSEKYDRDYQPLTDDQKSAMKEDEIKKWEEKAKTGLLRNDPILKKIVDDMRKAIVDTVENAGVNLSQIGITTGSYSEKGKLYIDETKLKSAISQNIDAVSNLFSKQSTTYPGTTTARKLTSEQKSVRYSEEGLVYRLYDIIEDNTSIITDSNGNKGILLKKAGMVGDSSEFKNIISDQLRAYDTDISNLVKKLSKKEDAYYKKFTELEKVMSKMNSQASWISAQFSGGSG